MFFTTEIAMPFETRLDAMNAHPEWKTKIREGNDMFFREYAEEGIRVYVEFWDRLQNTPEEVYFGSIKEGMEIIADDQIVIHIAEKALTQYFKANPTVQRPHTFPSEGEGFIENLVVTDNSPLGPILGLGCRILFENGVMDSLETKWIGKNVPAGIGGEAIAFALSPGQVVMTFVLLCSAVVASLVILGFENLIFIAKKTSLTIYDLKRQR